MKIWIRKQIKRLLLPLINKPMRRLIDPVNGPGQKRVLISYILPPENGQIKHTNQQEIPLIIEAFRKLGFFVDVVDCADSSFMPSKGVQYDVLFGFGQVYEKISYFLKPRVRIYYATGAEFQAENDFCKARTDYLQQRNGFLIFDSRFNYSNNWLEQATHVIAIANDFIKATYESKYPGLPIVRQLVTYQASCIPLSSRSGMVAAKNFTSASRNFLYFNGGGLIRKGLDLAIDVFRQLPELHLHICCPDLDPTEEYYYGGIIRNTPNISFHGLVYPQEPQFRAIIDLCAFAITPSASDGTNTAMLTCMAHGLIPLVSRGSGVDVGAAGVVFAEDTIESISAEVRRLAAVETDELRDRALAVLRDTIADHSCDCFAKQFEANLKSILNESVS
jgi:glycosyltransferase involved in cell wall biosynthesis